MKTYPLDFLDFIHNLFSMYIRKITRKKDGKVHAYWALVESQRTARGPRQRIVSYLGELDAGGRLGVQMAVEGRREYQGDLFEEIEPEWVEVNIHGVRTERVREFGDIWLALELIKRLGLDVFFRQTMPWRREEVSWADLACVLMIARFCSEGMAYAIIPAANFILRSITMGIPLWPTFWG